MVHISNLQEINNLNISTILKYKSQLPDFSKVLISVHEQDSLGYVLNTFREENIQSVPVYTNNHGREYIGIVGIYDILSFILFQSVFDTMATPSPLSEEETFTKFVEEKSALFHTPIKQLVESKTDKWLFYSSEPLGELLSALTRMQRVLVMNDDEQLDDDVCDRTQLICTKCCVVVVTRADVIRFVWDEYQLGQNVEFCKQLDVILDKKAMQVVKDTTPVTLELGVSALEAFRYS